MNEAMLAAMREQLCPSEAAQAALRVRLEEAARKKEERPMKKYLAVAACAALLLGVYPAYNALKPQPRLHTYTVVQDGQTEHNDLTVKKENSIAGTTEDMGGGAYISAPNTGVLPDPSGDDRPSQPGVDAYQLLMDHFGDTHPDWYGGAYVTDNGTLIVLLVDEKDPGDKTLELEVLEAAGGRTAPVGFASAKYSRNDLERINSELLTLLDGKGIFATWGIYDDQNRIVLDVAEPLPDDLLAAVAQLDPDDDAILIRVVEERSVITDVMKGPDPGGTTKAVEELPQTKGDVQRVEYDLLPIG